MKKGKPSLMFLSLFVILNGSYIGVSRATSTNVLSERALKAALEIGPERMVKFGFEHREHLGNVNYRNRKEVGAVQKHFVNLYPDRPDLYKRAACALGECLKEEGKYTQEEIKRVVGYITGLTEKYYGKQ